jgi:hypothetical protein
MAAGWALLGATAALGAAATINAVQAQDAPVGAAPAPGEPGGMGRMPGRGMGAPAMITANDQFVFVLRGNTLIKMGVADLKVVDQQQLPAAGAMMDGDRPAGAGRRGGGGGAAAPGANP